MESDDRKNMTDIYKYIISKDVVEHLQKINYKFSALQLTNFILKNLKFVSYKKNRIFTLKEIHEDLIKVMNEYPDEQLVTYESFELGHEKPSLFEMIQEKINVEDELIKEFYTQNGLYDYDNRLLFDNYEELEKYHFNNNDFEDNETFEISKRNINNERVLYVTMNNKLEPVEIIEIDQDAKCKLYTQLDTVMDQDCYKAVPLPFKNGDIVISANEEEKPMIIMSDEYEKECNGEDRFKIYDEYDPEEITCLFYEDGIVCYDHFIPTELETYKGEKTDEYKLLITLQKFMRKEIDLSTFLPAYHAALAHLGFIKKNVADNYYGNILLNEDILPLTNKK